MRSVLLVIGPETFRVAGLPPARPSPITVRSGATPAQRPPVAILAGRTSDGAGNPAIARSPTAISLSQRLFSAGDRGRSQTQAVRLLQRSGTDNDGRAALLRQPVRIGKRRPRPRRREMIQGVLKARSSASLLHSVKVAEDHPFEDCAFSISTPLSVVEQPVAGLQTEPRAYLPRDHGLRFAGDF